MENKARHTSAFSGRTSADYVTGHFNGSSARAKMGRAGPTLRQTQRHPKTQLKTKPKAQRFFNRGLPGLLGGAQSIDRRIHRPSTSCSISTAPRITRISRIQDRKSNCLFNPPSILHPLSSILDLTLPMNRSSLIQHPKRVRRQPLRGHPFPKCHPAWSHRRRIRRSYSSCVPIQNQ